MSTDFTVKPITVSDLIAFLQTQPQHLPVAYLCCSEQTLLRTEDIVVEKGCAPRPDGWVQDARPDQPSIDYLVFPGN
ncbi:hypothetical protein OU995_11825 [Roseateles sp. SL47]|uniref:hypothetical protein n=1 Tax=Roseateles sp. SL47 TaxID=2995138 RepID=UPI00226EC7A5|nr:hypothetical protein [Roseateles sp. SL47]WAC75337.1 hypothetical protein OU995_11825 [Roseateles sp. SL47]